jgi:hypothetical protein
VILTPEQESLYIADLEKQGVTQVRSDIEHGRISPQYVNLGSKWLSGKEREAERRNEASRAEQTGLMRRTTEATERQATQARRANITAIIALVIAGVSLIVSIVGTWRAR